MGGRLANGALSELWARLLRAALAFSFGVRDVSTSLDMTGHDVESVPMIGWAGIQNGELLERGVEEDFEVIIPGVLDS
jgi:hypothetical protein